MSICNSDVEKEADFEDNNQLEDDDSISDEDEGVEESMSSNFSVQTIVYSPQGSKYWIPKVNIQLIPRVGTFFSTYQEAISMYEWYADQGGFDVRLSTTVYGKNNMVRIKYVVCSRKGEAPKRSFDTVNESIESSRHRKSSLKITGCKACIRIRFVESRSSYEIYYFDDKHNHMLIDQNDMIMSRKRRQLCVTDQIFIHKAASSGVGATKAHKLQASLNGGYDVSGCTVSDYKNFRRDMNSFVGTGDGEMVLSMLEERCIDDAHFSFEYNRNNDQITGIFWADEVAKLNYQEFGDVTYQS